MNMSSWNADIIDHEKTAGKGLTGVDTDRVKEEKSGGSPSN